MSTSALHKLGLDPKNLATSATWQEMTVTLEEPVEDGQHPVYIVSGTPNGRRAMLAVKMLNPNVDTLMPVPASDSEFRVLTRVWR